MFITKKFRYHLIHIRLFFVTTIILVTSAFPVVTYAVDRVGVSDTTVTVVEEGESVEVTITLDEPIIGDPATVTIPVSVSDSSEVGVSTNSLEWSSGEWAESRTLIITAVDDESDSEI